MGGFAIYFPIKLGKETKPNMLPEHHDGDEGNPNQGMAIPNIVRCYWQRRLTPETSLRKLPFFPSEVTYNFGGGKTKKDNQWMRRMFVCIFFDRSFPVSNNKLRLLWDGIDDFINEKSTGTMKNVIGGSHHVQDEFKR